MRRAALLFLLGLLGCEGKPEEALCREADRCDHAVLLVDEDVCGEQVRVALANEGPDCQRCVTGLRCEAIEGVLSGKQQLRGLCTTCSEQVEIPVAEGAAPMLVTPAIAYRPPEVAEAAPQNDELVAQAEAVCAQADECDGVELLLKPEECTLQVSNALLPRDLECRRCASSLSCAGATAVVRGEQKLSALCVRCGDALDAMGVLATPGPGGPFLVIPGLVAAPSPLEEGEKEEGAEDAASPSTAAPTAPGAAPPAATLAPSAPAPASAPVTPIVPQPTSPATAPSAPQSLPAPAPVPPLPSR